MDEQKPRRRRAPQENVASSQEKVATGIIEATRITEERPAQHIPQNLHTAHKKHKKKRSSPAFIAATIIEGLIIAILALSIALFVMNGWTENGIIGFANGIITTPTPIPTPTPSATPTPIPTSTPTPQIEYIYITPQPTYTPIPTLTPTAIPTPVIEYIYITPEPTINSNDYYSQLPAVEKDYVDTLLKNIYSFKNPSSIRVKTIYKFGTGAVYLTTLSAQNGFGGNNISNYLIIDMLMKKIGDSDEEVKQMADIIKEATPYNFDYGLLNKALQQRISEMGY